tara:strand:+ start:2736 stop:3068 length:333 start_codon:yes stop_codon:yes gene_type:complete
MADYILSVFARSNSYSVPTASLIGVDDSSGDHGDKRLLLPSADVTLAVINVFPRLYLRSEDAEHDDDGVHWGLARIINGPINGFGAVQSEVRGVLAAYKHVDFSLEFASG